MNVVPLNVAMTVNSPRIPLEIVEFVIDVLNVDDEIDAIKACSQTCKVFFPAVGNTFFPGSISISDSIADIYPQTTTVTMLLLAG